MELEEKAIQRGKKLRGTSLFVVINDYIYLKSNMLTINMLNQAADLQTALPLTDVRRENKSSLKQ